MNENPYDSPASESDPSGAPAELSSDVKMWAMLCHLSALVGYIIPFGNVIGPLIFWMLKKDESPFIDANGKEAVNFQISILIYAIVSGILILVVIGILLLPIVVILGFVFMIVASIKSYSGESYRYPLTIRFI
jgi:uncharacterized Tic20 family protein